MASIEARITGPSAVTTAADTSALIKGLEQKGYRWVPVGGSSNNVGPIHVSTDSSEALNERITNAIDAMLEREWMEHQAKEPQPSTPREAAELWFKIPKRQLSTVPPLPDRRKLAENIRVTLLESKVEKSPSILIRDRGVGQNPADFADTLLGLNRDNKIHKHFLMGTYGMGGAAVYPFAQFTVIVSRRVPSLLGKGQSDKVGWTIVRYNPLDVNHKTGRYEYLVTANGDTPTMPLAGFEPGTEVRLIQYDLAGYHTIFTAPSRSLWALSNMVLYDPVLPFLIGDERTDRYKALKKSAVQRTRVVSGNANRLREKSLGKKVAASEEVEVAPTEVSDIRYHNEETINLREHGKIKVKYWVFGFKKGASSSPVDAYSEANSAIVVTLNGQRQEKFDRSYFRTYLDLHILKDYMLIQVDCDLLTKSGKKELFSSTREHVKRSSFLDALLDEMNDIVRKDKQVQKIKEELREAALQEMSSEENMRLSRQLDELVKQWELQDAAMTAVGQHMMSDKEGDPTVLTLKRGGQLTPPPEDEDDEDKDKAKPPPEPKMWKGEYFPTKLEFSATADPLRIPLGKPFALYMESDAVDDCLTRDADRGELEWSASPTGLLLERSRSQMRSGRVTIRLIATESAEADERVRVKVTLSFPGRPQLVAERDAMFVKTHKGKRKYILEEGRPNYTITALSKVNEHWEANGKSIDNLPSGWSEQSVSEVEASGNPIIIYVNMSNKDYVKAQLRRNLSAALMRRYDEKYKVAIAFHSLIQAKWEKEMAKQGTPVSDEALRTELERTVRTVIYTTFTAPEEQEILVHHD